MGVVKIRLLEDGYDAVGAARNGSMHRPLLMCRGLMDGGG
jgi:hypothetical protein